MKKRKEKKKCCCRIKPVFWGVIAGIIICLLHQAAVKTEPAAKDNKNEFDAYY